MNILIKINNLNNMGGGVLANRLTSRRHLACCIAGRPLKSFLLLLLLAVGLSLPAKAQNFSVISENIAQLVDVCRLEVVFNVDPDGSRAFSFSVYFDRGTAENDTRLASFSFSDVAVGEPVIAENEYSNLFSVVSSAPTSPDPDSDPTFRVTFWFNLPPDSSQEFRIGIGRFNMATTKEAYSIAKHCPKGN